MSSVLLTSAVAAAPHQLFCSTASGDDYHNRWTKHRRVLAPLEVADDREAKPPRMQTVEYVRLRLALGFKAT